MPPQKQLCERKKTAPSYSVDFRALCSFLSFSLPAGVGCTDPYLSRSVRFGAGACGSEGLRAVREDCPGPSEAVHSKGLIGAGGHGLAGAGAEVRRCWDLGALGRRSTPSRLLSPAAAFITFPPRFGLQAGRSQRRSLRVIPWALLLLVVPTIAS